jgi:hypothetical protein
MASSGMLRLVAFVRTDVSEELSDSITLTRIGELGTTLAVTSNRRMLRSVTSQKTPFFPQVAVPTCSAESRRICNSGITFCKTSPCRRDWNLGFSDLHGRRWADWTNRFLNDLLRCRTCIATARPACSEVATFIKCLH